MTLWVRRLADAVGLVNSRRFSVPWRRVEADIGSELPRDHKEFVEYFGPGNFDDYLWVHVPGVEAPWLELRH